MEAETASAINGIPWWLVWASVVASLTLMVFHIYDAIARAMRRPDVEVKLTREAFFRVFDIGECLYANVVLIAQQAAAMIKDVSFVLERTGATTKRFALDVVKIGKKVSDREGNKVFDFHSSSPILFIPENQPEQIVYLASQTTYSESIREYFAGFFLALESWKERLATTLPTDEEQWQPFIDEVEKLKADTQNRIMEKIQLEAGKYVLTATIGYGQKGGILAKWRIKEATSMLTFRVDDSAREVLRFQLQNYLDRQISNAVTGQYLPAAAPEYSPLDVREVD